MRVINGKSVEVMEVCVADDLFTDFRFFSFLKTAEMGNKKKERSKARKEEKKMIASQGELIKTSLEASSSLLLQGMEEQCTIGWNDHIVAAASNAGASEGGLKQEQDDLTLVYHSKDTLPSEWKVCMYIDTSSITHIIIECAVVRPNHIMFTLIYTQEPLFDIFQANMEAQYHANWGWREMEKRLEIFSQESRHLIAVQHKKPVGFIHLRYVLDQDGKILEPLLCGLSPLCPIFLPIHPPHFLTPLHEQKSHHKLSSISTRSSSCHPYKDVA